MSNNKTIYVLIIIVLLFSNIDIYESILLDKLYSYSIFGEYIGKYRLELSGYYKTLFTGNNSDYKYGYLTISYRYSFNLNILFSNYTYYFLYIYSLNQYSLDYLNIPDNIISIINNTLSKFLNKTIIEYDLKVDPSLIIKIVDWNNYSITFEKLGSNRVVNGLSLFDDVVCFEYTLYREEISSEAIKRFISKSYYETISYTPLYVYEHSVYTDLFNETNYMRIFIEITQKNIGYSLSKISRSRTYYIVFENKLSGRFGLITYGNYSMELIYRNNTLNFNINSNYPYRVVIITDHPIEVEYSNIVLNSFNLKINNIYLAPVLLSNTGHVIVFNHNISEIRIISENISFIHDITIQEKRYSSLSITLFTIFVNILAIYIVYKISKYFTKLIYEVLK